MGPASHFHSKTFAFLVMDEFPMSCLTSAIEPLRAANEIYGEKAFDWLVVSEKSNPVASSAQVSFDPDVTLADLPACHGIYILSSPLGHFTDQAKANAILRRLLRRGSTVGAFSGGVFCLARCGLLDDKKCSIHWVYEAAFKEQFPDVLATNKVITVDQNIETASGSAAVFDLMLGHIEQNLGAEIMSEVACWFQHPHIRGEDIAQRVPLRLSTPTQDMMPPVVAKAIQQFSLHLDSPISIENIASMVHVSSRQLNRVFQQATGKTPQAYYRMLRMEKARQLVLYSHKSLTDIALAVGYSPVSFTRHYKDSFGILPSQHRKQAMHQGALPHTP